jgi:S1-C subfamily serine protease
MAVTHHAPRQGSKGFKGRFRSSLLAAAATAALTLAASHASAGLGGSFVDPTIPSSIQQLQQQFEVVGKRAAPSIVAIWAAAGEGIPDAALVSGDLTPGRLDGMLRRATKTVGTGFVVDPAGYIVTNEHVISGADAVWVTTDSGAVLPAIVVGSDPRSDLAVLKVPVKLPALRLVDAKEVERGQWTITLGNPIGLAGEGEMAMSVGIVSATKRSLPRLSRNEKRLYLDLIQTTAEVNPGNSGGPLLDANGDVIGVVTAVVMPQRTTNGLGFAIPIDERFRATVDQLKQGREIRYGYVGVMVSKATAQLDGQPFARAAVRIDGVEIGSPAHDAELADGEIVLAVNGVNVASEDEFVLEVGRLAPDQPAKLTLCRNGRATQVTVRPRQRVLPADPVCRGTQKFRWRGATLANATAGAGVRIDELDENSPLRDAGARPGDRLLDVAGKPVADLASLHEALMNSAGKQVAFKFAPAAASPAMASNGD